MNIFQEKFKLLKNAVMFTAAILFVFSFFQSGSAKSTDNTLKLQNEFSNNSSLPADRQFNFQKSIFNNPLPTVQSSKSENTVKSPPRNQHETLLEISAFEIIRQCRHNIFKFEDSTFQICLKNSIPIRAGPLFI